MMTQNRTSTVTSARKLKAVAESHRAHIAETDGLSNNGLVYLQSPHKSAIPASEEGRRTGEIHSHPRTEERLKHQLQLS